MNKQKPRDTPEIVVPKGYELTDLIDTDDRGYGFEDEAIYTEEVRVIFEWRSEKQRLWETDAERKALIELVQKNMIENDSLAWLKSFREEIGKIVFVYHCSCSYIIQ